MSSITCTYDRPVTRRERLGSVPRDYVERAGVVPQHGLGHVQTIAGNETGPVDVMRSVPVYTAEGKPQMESVTETFTAEPYSVGARSTMYAALGGVAAGAAAGCLAGPVGIAVGAVAGGASGALLGSKSASNDDVSEVWRERSITHPTMDGHYHCTIPVPVRRKDDEGKAEWGVAGYVHHHQPKVSHEKVGSYRQPGLEHSRKLGSFTGAVLTAGAGALIGLVAGLLLQERD